MEAGQNPIAAIFIRHEGLRFEYFCSEKKQNVNVSASIANKKKLIEELMGSDGRGKLSVLVKWLRPLEAKTQKSAGLFLGVADEQFSQSILTINGSADDEMRGVNSK